VFDVAVFDGIEVHVIHMRSEVGVVADAMLPKAPLPDPTFPVTLAGVRPTLVRGQTSRKDRLDQAPARRKVVVAGGQRPDTMQMIGEDHPGIDAKRAGSVHGPYRTPQQIDALCQQIIPAPFQQIDGEEEASARYAMATVVGNGALLPFNNLVCATHHFASGGLRFALVSIGTGTGPPIGMQKGPPPEAA
jgi:hypothetical protein